MTAKQLAEYEQAFALLDKNGDGKITKVELGEVLKSLGYILKDSEIEDMLRSASRRKSETVTFSEFMTAMETVAREKIANIEMLESFKVFDLDGDGYITFSELKDVMENKFGAKGISDERIQDMIDKADIDGDGRVNYSGMSNVN